MTKSARIDELSNGINILPNELLVYILGFLNTKEAVVTSILCRRWRHLWTLIFTNKLDFDGLLFYWRVWLKTNQFKYPGLGFFQELWTVPKYVEESWNYITWVDNVLAFHKGCRIDEFRVDFFLTEAHKKHIDEWLRFASDKKVRRLELNLKWKVFGGGEAYTFPNELSINFKHLQTMRMQLVNISGEGLEFLLGTCPLLEELSVSYSQHLTSIKIIGPSLALKHLEIIYCDYLTSVEIRDVNLVFFMYHGRLEQLVLENVPLLVEMHLGGEINNCMEKFLLMFSSCLPLLEKLTMDEVRTGLLSREIKYVSLDKKAAKMFYNNMKMSNLKQLVFKFQKGRNFTPLTYFIRASPMLQSFVFESYGQGDDDYCLSEKVGPYQHPHLKRVEFIGYRGTQAELDLIVDLLNNGGALEEFVIDLRKRAHAQNYYNFYWPNSVHGVMPVGYDSTQEDEINAAKDRVRDQFTKILPSTLQHLRLSIL